MNSETTPSTYDAIILGGGFFGCAIAIYLAQERGFRKIAIIEQESEILQRASLRNQARVHNGYHYPRSLLTAQRSRINFPRFINRWNESIFKNSTSLYAIARLDSKVNAQQFERFCKIVEIPFEVATPQQSKFFNSRLIEKIYQVEECAFNAQILARKIKSELHMLGIHTFLNTQAKSIVNLPEKKMLQVTTHSNQWLSKYVFNCTYSGLNNLGGEFSSTRAKLKHEIAELAVVNLPDSLSEFSITVMDGPFFSLVPYPILGRHTFSHVRYTPHKSYTDLPSQDLYFELKKYEQVSRFDRMIKDATRYIPDLIHTQYIKSLFEIKTILVNNEADDGRPILFEKHETLPGCFSILGGKIDNIFDITEKLNSQEFLLKLGGSN